VETRGGATEETQRWIHQLCLETQRSGMEDVALQKFKDINGWLLAFSYEHSAGIRPSIYRRCPAPSVVPSAYDTDAARAILF
jgi:hypothetical protein